jgi:prepilin-type N-terminal cleavage/methylation domain-containing protein
MNTIQSRQEKGKRASKRAGFTLTEIMVSVSILSLITAISVPMFTRVKIGANEAAAQKALKTYREAFINFQIDSGTLGYPDSLNQLDGYVDDALSQVDASRNGYNYRLTAVNAVPGQVRTTYRIEATPINPGVTGVNSFFLEESGTVALLVGAAPIQDPGGSPSFIPTLASPTDVFGTTGFLSTLLGDATRNDTQKADILAGLILNAAFAGEQDFLNGFLSGLDPRPDGQVGSAFLAIPSGNELGFNKLFEEAKGVLENRGVSIYLSDPGPDVEFGATYGQQEYYYWAPESAGGHGLHPSYADQTKVVQVGYEFNDTPVGAPASYYQQEQLASDLVKEHRAYANHVEYLKNCEKWGC